MIATPSLHPDLGRDRLPTLFEVLSRQTLAPVDLFSLYIECVRGMERLLLMGSSRARGREGRCCAGERIVGARYIYMYQALLLCQRCCLGVLQCYRHTGFVECYSARRWSVGMMQRVSWYMRCCVSSSVVP